MNAKTDFHEPPTPQAVRRGSPEWQKTVSCMTIVSGLAYLAGLNDTMNAFATFFATASLNTGIEDDEFERGLAEWAHVARLNRAQMQSQRSTAQQS